MCADFLFLVTKSLPKLNIYVYFVCSLRRRYWTHFGPGTSQ